MKEREKSFLEKRVVYLEVMAFFGVIAVIWLDEILDIPFFLFAAERSPLNWREALFETVFVAALGLGVVYYTKGLFKRLKHLEGLLPICASCKKIRDKEGKWHPVEAYIRERTEAEFSHGICTECAERLYPDVFGEQAGGQKGVSQKKS